MICILIFRQPAVHGSQFILLIYVISACTDVFEKNQGVISSYF